MAHRDPPPQRGHADDDQSDQLWAELEGGTEGPTGRGRDQEVISQTDRPESVDVAADRGMAARELLAELPVNTAGDPDLTVERVENDSILTLTLRSRGPGARTVTLQFDLSAGTIAIDRGDGSDRAMLEVDARDPELARSAIRDAVCWARSGAAAD
jgi:hypothetical protein